MIAVRVVRYVISLVALTLISGMAVIVAALIRVQHRRGGIYDRAAKLWAGGLIAANGLVVAVRGRELLEPSRPCVYVSNHSSFADIWLLFSILPLSTRFVAKRELLSVPFFGRAVRASGQIPIDRTNLRDAFAAYDEAAAAIRSGMSAIVFAEGTRSRDGQLKEFKKGPFVLAIAAGVPVVPVLIEHSRDALPPGAWWVRPVPVRVTICPQLPTDGLDFDDRDTLAQAARASMLTVQE